jgi:hypothetical protein
VDLVLDVAPISGALPDLLQIANGDPRHVLTIVDFAAAELGVRTTFGEDQPLRYDVLDEYAQRAADGQFTIPIARNLSPRRLAHSTRHQPERAGPGQALATSRQRDS